MFKKSFILLVAIGLLSTNASASEDLIVVVSLDSFTDLLGLTALLENGLAGNILGGMASDFAWAGSNTLLATLVRGPNATAYNSAVDDRKSYIPRFKLLQ